MLTSAPTEPCALSTVDTAVVIDENGQVLGKPADKADAERMIRLLAGRTHDVLTGIHLLRGDRSLAHIERSQVRMSALTEAEITWYIASGEPMDKAGAYAIQGLGARFVEEIRGDFFNVMGLPVRLLYEMVQESSDGR